MSQHHLTNQAFENYDEIVDKVCNAWNSFLKWHEKSNKGTDEKLDQPDQLIS